MNTKNEQEKYKEPFKLTVNRKSKTKSELSVQEVKPFAPTIPVIDLTPSTILMRYDKEKLINKFAVSLIGVIALFATIWGINLTLAGFQSNSNANTQAQIQALQQQLGDVEAYRVYADGIKLVRENMYDVVKNNLDMAKAMNVIVKAANDNNIRISTIKITEDLSTTEQNICIPSTAFGANKPIGCVSMSGTAKDNNDVIKFFDAIVKDNGFDDSFINSIGVSGNDVIFNGTVGITENLKIKRYDYLSTQLVTIDAILGLGGLSLDTINQLLKATSSDTNTDSIDTDNANSNTDSTSQDTNTNDVNVVDAIVDARYDNCAAAIAAGYGPYTKGADAEYEWYQSEDTDNNGSVCEG